jgi:MoaA/NifB/PqqE/SkfB family radical SAM enzyme
MPDTKQGDNAWQHIAIQAADVAMRFGPLRRWALDWGDRRLYDFYCRVNIDKLPIRVQQMRHRALMNLLHALERAIADGRCSSRARRGILRNVVGYAVMGGRRTIAPFVREHGFEPPAFVAISPTQLCNLRCTGCYAASSSEQRSTLGYTSLRRIVRQKRDQWGSHFTVITGGEPLLYRSEGRTLADLCNEFPDEYFLVYTNGTLIDVGVAERFAALGNVSFAISVEGFEAETDARRGPGVFRKIENAMVTLRRCGVPFGISMTATRQNAAVLLSENIISHYFDERGAVYAWLFQYMPIGRGYTLDAMVTPGQRLELLRRQLELLWRRKLFFIDFWNGGPMSAGCIAAGREGGYLHIDWNGNVSPCVFVPYAVANVVDLFDEGETLSSVLMHPVFERIRAWQADYQGKHALTETRNLFRPCPMRDHHHVVREAILRHGAIPSYPDAASALGDPEYARRLSDYGSELALMLDPIWQSELRSTNHAPEPNHVAPVVTEPVRSQITQPEIEPCACCSSSRLRAPRSVSRGS